MVESLPLLLELHSTLPRLAPLAPPELATTEASHRRPSMNVSELCLEQLLLGLQSMCPAFAYRLSSLSGADMYDLLSHRIL